MLMYAYTPRNTYRRLCPSETRRHLTYKHHSFSPNQSTATTAASSAFHPRSSHLHTRRPTTPLLRVSPSTTPPSYNVPHSLLAYWCISICLSLSLCLCLSLSFVLMNAPHHSMLSSRRHRHLLQDRTERGRTYPQPPWYMEKFLKDATCACHHTTSGYTSTSRENFYHPRYALGCTFHVQLRFQCMASG